VTSIDTETTPKPVTKEYSEFGNELPTYLGSLLGRNEPTRRSRFQDLLRDYFDIRADELERTIHEGGHGSRVIGRVDALAGNVILEFKVELTPGLLDDAKDQLLKYVRALTTAGDSRRYTLIATDGNAFQPFWWDGSSGQLEPSDSIVRFEDLGERAYIWLDDWIASRIRNVPTKPQPGAVAEILGSKSPVFLQAFAILLDEWGRVMGDHGAAFQQWQKSLVHVYGSNLATIDLFVRHTYVTTVAKVLVFFTLRPDEAVKKARTDGEVREILDGGVFRRFGIQNLSEYDFLSWVAGTRGGMDVVKGLLDACTIWDFEQVETDLLRAIYEELIDPKTRHDLGEFYTPLWVAQMVVEEALPSPGLTVIDPTCGSGTFLAAAIQKKIAQGEKLDAILNEVVGVDIHPVAVVVARANYLLALRPVLGVRGRGSLSIPVFLSDSIQPQKSEFRHVLSVPGTKVECYELSLRDPTGKASTLQVPASLVRGLASDPMLDAMDRAVEAGTWTSVEPIVSEWLGQMSSGEQEANVDLVKQAFEEIHRLHTLKRDRIYVFLLRNYFRPSALAGTFDRVIGNPPWIVFNSLKDSELQQLVRTAFTTEHLMPVASVAAVITQLDVCALFFSRTGNTYLKPRGKIRFLMPQPLLSKKQFSGFRANLVGLDFDKVWDMSGARPIFRSSQTVIVGGTKSTENRAKRDPIPALRVSGSVGGRDVTFASALPKLRIDETTLTPVGESFVWAYPEQDLRLLNSTRSPYYAQVRNGATLFPYPIVLVDIEVDPRLGVDTSNPAIRSSVRGNLRARRAYRGIQINGSTEGEFLYHVVTMSEVLPFGFLELPTAALPIIPKPSREGSDVLDSAGLRSAGRPRFAAYFEKEEQAWVDSHKNADKPGIRTLKKQIDHLGKLAHQPANPGFFVVIPTSARRVLAAVIPQGPGQVKVGAYSVPTRGIVVDHGNNYLFTQSGIEANYLCGFLNSGKVNSVIKPSILKGRDSERNTYKGPLELPIPLFNGNNAQHAELARISSICADKVPTLLTRKLKPLADKASTNSHALGQLREEIISELGRELGSINAIVEDLLN
jgi:N-6 DNA Methylase